MIYTIKINKQVYKQDGEQMPGLARAIRKYNERIIEERTVKRNKAAWGRINRKFQEEHKEEQEKMAKYAAKLAKTAAIEDYCERFEKMLEMRR